MLKKPNNPINSDYQTQTVRVEIFLKYNFGSIFELRNVLAGLTRPNPTQPKKCAFCIYIYIYNVINLGFLYFLQPPPHPFFSKLLILPSNFHLTHATYLQPSKFNLLDSIQLLSSLQASSSTPSHGSRD